MSSYSKKEWGLVIQVMDTVDTIRLQSESPINVPKVKALVVRTYAQQGIRVPERLIDDAIAAATDAFAPPIVSPQAPQMAWWERKLCACEEHMTLLEKAQRRVEILKTHQPLSQRDIANLIEQEKAALSQEQAREQAEHDALTKKSLRTERTWVRIGGGLIGGLIWFCLPWYFGLGAVLFFMVVPQLIQEPSFGPERRNNHFSQIKKFLSRAEQAFQENEGDQDDLQGFLGRALEHDTPYDSRIIPSPRSHQWRQAREDAKIHPIIAQVWAHWLASDKPLRQGDFDLISRANYAVSNVLKAMRPPEAEPMGFWDRMLRKSLLWEARKYS